MRNQFVTIGIIVILVCVGLSGCNQISNTLNPEKNKFVGTWNYQYGKKFNCSVTFISDGTYSNSRQYCFGDSGSWNITDSKLVVNYLLNGEPAYSIYSYSFYNNSNNVTLTDVNSNMTLNMTKQ